MSCGAATEVITDFLGKRLRIDLPQVVSRLTVLESYEYCCLVNLGFVAFFLCGEFGNILFFCLLLPQFNVLSVLYLPLCLT